VAFPVKERFSDRDKTGIDTSIHRELGFLMGAFLMFGTKFNIGSGNERAPLKKRECAMSRYIKFIRITLCVHHGVITSGVKEHLVTSISLKYIVQQVNVGTVIAAVSWLRKMWGQSVGIHEAWRMGSFWACVAEYGK